MPEARAIGAYGTVPSFELDDHCESYFRMLDKSMRHRAVDAGKKTLKHGRVVQVLTQLSKAALQIVKYHIVSHGTCMDCNIR